jgi:multidrug efflux system membrane fusion protein
MRDGESHRKTYDSKNELMASATEMETETEPIEIFGRADERSMIEPAAQTPNKGNGRTAAEAQPAPSSARRVEPLAAAAAEQPQRELDYSASHAPAKSHWWVWLLVLVVLGAGGVFAYPHMVAYFRSAKGGAGGPGGQAQMKREVPVLAATARKGNLDLYLDGLGTVTPFYTVSVKSRVDGQIVKVGFKEGQIVKEGDPLFEIDPRPYEVMLTQAQGAYARDQALLENAKADLRKYMEAGEAAVGKQIIDTQKATVAQYEGVLKADQGQIDNVNLQLVYCHITAPISGRIGLRMVDQGNMVHASDTTVLAVITQLQPIAVKFTIPQDQIARLLAKPNGGEGLAVVAYDRDFKKKLASGTVIAIDNEVDPTTGTVQVKASFGNENNALFPSQFVNARLLIDTIKDAVIVPAAAVQSGPEWSFAYVVKKDDGTVDLRKVRVGETEGDQTIVEEGLEPGDVVVTDGVDKLQKGMKVAVRTPGEGGGGKRGGGGKGAATTATTGAAGTTPSASGS